jgi:CMP-N-acetylneuraminic acid synthetase
MKILVIIPAKTDSTRLKKKNLRELNGKSLVEHSIDYAKASKYEVEIIVSSESDEVREVSLKNNVIFRSRGIELCGDAEVVDVYLDIVANINATFDLVVGLQPDNPNRSHTLDECIDYMLKNDYDDLITVNPEYKRSGSVRIFKYNYIKTGKVSKRLGCIRDNAVDIHYQTDLDKIINNY